MPKLIIQQPYVIKSDRRKEQFDRLIKSWKEGGIIAVDATTRITLVRDDEKIDEIIASDIVDNDKWITITESTFAQYEPNIYECPKCSKRVTVRTPFCPECGDDKRLRVKMEEPTKPDEELERSEDALKQIKETGHSCKTCKYGLKSLTAEPCSSCDIRLGNNKWEPDEEDKDGDK